MLISLDYISQWVIPKLHFPYNIIAALIIFFIIPLYYWLNKKTIDEWVKSHRKNLNRFVLLIFISFILFSVLFYIYDNFYSPKPPEDQLVVAISPFYYIDESGRTGSDINTANDFMERLYSQKDLELKVIILENPIHDVEDAKSQGKKVGAHLVVYGETKKKIGDIDEIKYIILPLPSLEIISSDRSSIDIKAEKANSLIFTQKATISRVTKDPIEIIESLKENAASEVYVIGALEQYKKSNFTSAIGFFKSVKNYENNPLILFYIATCYYLNNNLTYSLQYFNKATEIDPLFEEAWSSKGVSLSYLGRYKEALVALDKAIELNPQDAKVWFNKGLTLSRLFRFEEALVAYDKAIELNPRDVDTWNEKGYVLGGLGRFTEALVAYDKAIELDSRSADAWRNKGSVLNWLGRLEESLVASDKALELNPRDVWIWNNKGAVLNNLGRNEEALVAYDRGIEIDPQNAMIWKNKGITLCSLGRQKESDEATERAHELDPAIPRVGCKV